jgi:Hint domain
MAIHWTGGGTGTQGKPVSGDWNDASNWSPSGVPGDGDKVVLGGGINSSAYVVTLDTSTNDLDSITIGGSGGFVTLDITESGALNVSNTVSVGNASITMEGGQISAYSMDLAQPDSLLSGYGVLNVSDNYTGTGTIEAADGKTLTVDGDVGNGIQLKIAAGSDLQLNGQADTGGTVSFAGANGILDLTGEGRGPNNELTDFHDTVQGFAGGDKIEVAGAPGDKLSFDTTTDVLTVKNGSHTEETIQLNGSYTQNEFHITTTTTASGSIDTITICFMAGTMIAVPDGSVAVEALKRGDLVLTTDGRAVPVSWLGHQTVSTVFGDPLRVLPIRIKAGAIAENVPSRDLLLSPDHAILVDGALIQAGALVNGTSVVREADVPQTFTYYHVEVDDHALILAENIPAETFVDNVERLAFDNWAEHQALYPEGKSITELPYPRAKAHRQVPVNIRAKLAERAQAIGAAAGTAAVA